MKNLTKEDREKLYKYSNEENIQKKLEIIADLYSRNQDNYKIMFKFLVTLGKFEEYRPRAKELLKDLVGKVNPSAIYFEIGKLDVLDKDLEGAVKNFEESLFYNERNTGSKLELAKVYRYMRRLEDAKSMLYNLLKSTDDGAAYYELGVISKIEGKDKKAEDYYQKSLTIRKSDIRALFKIGKIKRKNGDYEEAKKYCSLKLILQPIAENCILHGMGKSFMRIQIIAEKRNSEIWISIQDDGEGMQRERLLQIQKELEEGFENTEKHIGLGNVNKRIRLYFGEAYGVIVTSENHCTKVDVHFPAVLEDCK